MPGSSRIDDLKQKFDQNPHRYFAPLANEYRKAGEIARAVAICREFLADQPGHLSGHVVLGKALFAAGDRTGATAAFEAALDADPENVDALHQLALLARDEGDADRSLAHLERALLADPRNPELVAMAETLAGPSAESVTPPSFDPQAAFDDVIGAGFAPLPNSGRTPAVDRLLALLTDGASEATAASPEPAAASTSQEANLSAESLPGELDTPGRADRSDAIAAPERADSDISVDEPPPGADVERDDTSRDEQPWEVETAHFDASALSAELGSTNAAPPDAARPGEGAAGDDDLSTAVHADGWVGDEPAEGELAEPPGDADLTAAVHADGWMGDESNAETAPPADATTPGRGVPMIEFEPFELEPPDERGESRSVVSGTDAAGWPAWPEIPDEEAELDDLEQVAWGGRAGPDVAGDAASDLEAFPMLSDSDATVANAPRRTTHRSEVPADTSPSADFAETLPAHPALARLPEEQEVPAEARVSFVTATMAELLLSQGRREDAAEVYRRLLDARPNDLELQRRLAALVEPPGDEMDAEPDAFITSSPEGEALMEDERADSDASQFSQLGNDDDAHPGAPAQDPQIADLVESWGGREPIGEVLARILTFAPRVVSPTAGNAGGLEEPTAAASMDATPDAAPDAASGPGDESDEGASDKEGATSRVSILGAAALVAGMAVGAVQEVIRPSGDLAESDQPAPDDQPPAPNFRPHGPDSGAGGWESLFGGATAGSIDQKAADLMAGVARALGDPAEASALESAAADQREPLASVLDGSRRPVVTPARPGPAFSFDQFFRDAIPEGADPGAQEVPPELVPPPTPRPSETSAPAESLDDFHAWLNSLRTP